MQYLKKISENHKEQIILAAIAGKDGTMSFLFKNFRTAKLSAVASKKISSLKTTRETRLKILNSKKQLKL